MIFTQLNRRAATLIRLAGLVLIGLTVIRAGHAPGWHGRGLVITVSFTVCAITWLVWAFWSTELRRITPDLYVLAGAGGLLVGASPSSAASAFVFVAAVSAGARVELKEALTVTVVGILATAVSVLIYDVGALTLVAYSLGYAAATLGATNIRQARERAEQSELLLAQTQRSHEEQLRSARLEESTRIAREIHDVLAHALAGLTIQLEATSALVEQGADRETVLARIARARELAREGLRETRRAVGALRGDAAPGMPGGLEALVGEFQAATETSVALTIDGDSGHLTGEVGEAVFRVVQEALTNVRKHAPGAVVTVSVHVDEDVVAVIENGRAPTAGDAAPSPLAGTGGGYGIQGMRERADLLGGSLEAGAFEGGWRVELRLPVSVPAGRLP